MPARFGLSGFTGHKDPIVHVRKLAAERNFHFDSCQMPLNVLDAHFQSFERMWCRKEIAVLG